MLAVTPPAEALTVASPLGGEDTAGTAGCGVLAEDALCGRVEDWVDLVEDPPQPPRVSTPAVNTTRLQITPRFITSLTTRMDVVD